MRRYVLVNSSFRRSKVRPMGLTGHTIQHRSIHVMRLQAKFLPPCRIITLLLRLLQFSLSEEPSQLESMCQ